MKLWFLVLIRRLTVFNTAGSIISLILFLFPILVLFLFIYLSAVSGTSYWSVFLLHFIPIIFTMIKRRVWDWAGHQIKIINRKKFYEQLLPNNS
jgi:hypothetical protein